MVNSALLVGLLLSSANATLVYDSGQPVPRSDGDIAFMSVWRVLDPADNLCVRVIVPIELDTSALVTSVAFYSFNPKDPAEKIVDIYNGTDEDSVGTLRAQLCFEEHQGVTQGWNLLTLEQPILLLPGEYGIAFHGRYEFHSYWAANAPNGPGWAWARPNDDLDWFRGGEDDFGVLPNFGVRVYALQAEPQDPIEPQPPDPDGSPRSRPLSGGTAGPAPAVPVDTSVPGTPNNYEYEPGTREQLFHVVWRPTRSAKAAPAQPK